MNNDLINRKAVLEVLYDISSRNYGSFFGHGINKACDVIEHADTAFDKEKVIEELDKLTGEECTLHECGIRSERCKPCIAKKAIEIVEKGGIERRE